MISKSLTMRVVLLPFALAPVACAAQAGHQAAPTHQIAPSGTPVAAAPAPAHGSTAAPVTVNPSTPPNCEGGACDVMPSHITIATPAPAPAPWPLQDRIAWAASLILTIMAYVGIMLAVSALRKIERQTRCGETAAQAAAESAKAALLLAQAQAQQAEAQAQAERPWVLITAEPAPGVPSAFTVTASNRGHGPARIVSLAEEITTAVDESQLTTAPAFASEPRAPVVPIILLPGESTGIKSFRRDDVKSLCITEERLRRVEDWEEKIYLYGSVVYQDLRSIDEKQVHETSWCCWYIHGRQKSGMVMAGPSQYNRHT